MFPLDKSRIIKEAYDGALTVLFDFPLQVGINVFLMLINKLLSPHAGKEVVEPCRIANLPEEKPQESILDTVFYCVFLAPLWEEFFFRGILTPALRACVDEPDMHPSAGSLTSMLFFACGHYSFLTTMHGANRFETLTHSHNGSLWSSITAHSLHNLIIEILEYNANNIEKIFSNTLKALRLR